MTTSAEVMAPPFERIPAVRIGYNVGCMMDIPSGSYVFGKYGESLLTGGATQCTGIVGKGNMFKSTIMHYMLLMILARFNEAVGMTYDTEINISEQRLSSFAEEFIKMCLMDSNPIDDGRWVITDKSQLFGDEWFDKFKEFIKNKVDNAKKVMRESPFLERDGKTHMQVMVPSPAEIDSFSEFETQDVATMKDENSLGEKGANTIFMRQGLSKTRMIQELPKLIAMGNTPLFLTAHIGKLIPMDAHAPPDKKLQYLTNGDEIKGVTAKFTYLTTIAWQCTNATVLSNDSTKAPEYPASPDDDMKLDTDLNLVTLKLLRNKWGRSGLQMQVIVSQENGVQASLSEFHYIKTNKYGLDGNLQNYNLFLCPDIKLSRTAIRSKIAKHPELRRALTITSELLQLTMLLTDKEDLFCTPKELYEDLIALGYKWEQLLATRTWWTFENDKHAVPYLSTMDLLRMRKKLYVPFWMKADEVPVACRDIPRPGISV